ITHQILKEVPRLARSRGIPSQGSSRDHLSLFRSFDLITPNDREALGAVGGRRDDLRGLRERLKKAGRPRQVIVTLGPEGMALFPERGPMATVPTLAREVVDVTGAGDSV